MIARNRRHSLKGMLLLLGMLALLHARAAAQPPSVSFGSNSGSGLETASPISIPVTLSREIDRRVMVNYKVTGGTATRNIDYRLNDGVLVFNPVDRECDIRLDVIDDRLSEPPETVVLTLSDPTSATLGAITQFTYTIIDVRAPNQPPPR